MKGWLAQLPAKYHQRATCMFDRHGLLALLAGRFSCICPYAAANHGGNFRSAKPPLPVFQLVGLLWVSVVTSFGYALSMIPFVKRHEDQVMTFLMILANCLVNRWLVRHAVCGD